jgi:DeoR family transcriptional regulator, suf operon transcriptional repressor
MDQTFTSVVEMLTPARRAILEHIKIHQPVRAEDIARALHVTVSGVRQHLAGLSAEGLVSHEVRRGSPGRPKHLYSLSERGEDLFPRNYRGFATEAVMFLGNTAPDVLDAFLERRKEQRLAIIQPELEGQPLRRRIESMANALDCEGYMAGVVDDGDGTFSIVERNCAILELARTDQRICSSEMQWLAEALPDTEVMREQHILDREPICLYRIRPRDLTATA